MNMNLNITVPDSRHVGDIFPEVIGVVDTVHGGRMYYLLSEPETTYSTYYAAEAQASFNNAQRKG